MPTGFVLFYIRATVARIGQKMARKNTKNESNANDKTQRARTFIPVMASPDEDDFDFEDGEESVQSVDETKTESVIETVSKESIALPDAPAENITWPIFDKWQMTLTEMQLMNVMFYVYRLYPVVNIKQVDPSGVSYVEKHLGSMGPLTRDKIITLCGGGTYNIKMNDLSRRRTQTVTEIKLEVPLSEASPILDLRTLVVEHPMNAGYVKMLQAAGMLDAQLKIVDKNRKENEMSQSLVDRAFTELKESRESERQLLLDQLKARNPDDTALARGIELVQAGAMASLDLIKQQAATQNNPGQILEILKFIRESSPLPVASSPDNSLYVKMWEMSEKRAERLEEQILKLTTERAQPTQSKLSEMREMLEFAQSLGALGGGEKVGVGERIVNRVMDALPDVFGLLNGVFLQPMMAQRTMAQNVPQGAQPTGNPGTATPSEQPFVPSNAGANGQMLSESEQGQVLQAWVDKYKGLVLSNLSQGKSGSDAAVDLCNFTNDGVYYQTRNFIKQFGVVKVTEKLYEIPEFQEQCMKLFPADPKAGLQRWINDFVEFDPEKAE